MKEAEISSNDTWFVYILRCGNGALYTGVTTDVARRLAEHTAKGRRGARFTRAFAPVELVYSCRVGSKNLAYRVEHQIKQLPRKQKTIVVVQQLSREMLLEFLGIDTKN